MSMSLNTALMLRFMDAQQHEERGDEEAAAMAYESLVDAYYSAFGEGQTPSTFDEATVTQYTSGPPSSLIASIALNSLGGFLIDEKELERARSCFKRSLALWPAHAMALVNLGDLEREHGSRDLAFSHYSAAAALPPCEEVEACGWCATWVEGPRAEAVSLATYMVVLHLHQRLECDRALQYLKRFAEVGYRIAPHVWHAIAQPSASKPLKLAASAAADWKRVRRFDGALPTPLLGALRLAFSPSSPFWRETDYAARGYFSFWHSMQTAPSNIVEFLAHHLLPLTGCAGSVVGAEWWVHTRTEARSIGHQMHWDTEECTLASGRLLHPLVSTVVYLSGAPSKGGGEKEEEAEEEGGASAAGGLVGDPTVVFEMTVEDEAASSAAISHPQQGSVLLFPGDRLHCVCPAGSAAAASPPPSHATQPPARKRPKKATGTTVESALIPSHEQPQRLTLMIGFWGEDVAGEARRHPLGACGPLPRTSRRCGWPSTLAIPEGLAEATPPATSIAVPHAVPAVADPWEALLASEDEDEDEAQEGSDDAWHGRLEVPEPRNHRFFVSGLDEFRSQLVPAEEEASSDTSSDCRCT